MNLGTGPAVGELTKTMRPLEEIQIGSKSESSDKVHKVIISHRESE
jgi:hypothetical protein